MPRPKSHDRNTLLTDAMQYFWSNGYATSSMDQLVNATNVSRHGIYADFGNKRQLFLACMDFYQSEVVTPGFRRVESPEANIDAIHSYFETQMSLAEVPGPGCFMANTSTELGPHDVDVQLKIIAHHARLKKGFVNALKNESAISGGDISAKEIREIAELLVSFAQGLWLLSRSIENVELLKKLVRTQLSLVRSRLSHQQNM